METAEILGLFSKQLVDLGLAGLVIVVLIVAVVAIWKAYQKERARCAKLTDDMLEMAKETNTLIERITGR